jgi:hypothetical protein
VLLKNLDSMSRPAEIARPIFARAINQGPT